MHVSPSSYVLSFMFASRQIQKATQNKTKQNESSVGTDLLDLARS